MKLVLPYNAKNFLEKFYMSSANEPFSCWKTCIIEIWECGMNFNAMVEKLDSKTKAYRPNWGEGELLWKSGNILVHNTPYWSGEQKNQMIDGYPYVCEKRDIDATDWVLVRDET